MGTQGPGRKRIPNREKLSAEDDALNQIAREVRMLIDLTGFGGEARPVPAARGRGPQTAQGPL